MELLCKRGPLLPSLLKLSTNLLSHQSAWRVQHLSPAAFLGPVSHSRFTDDRLMCLCRPELQTARAGEEHRRMQNEAGDERVEYN